MKQPAERQISDEGTCQDGVNIPYVAVNACKGSRGEKQPTDQVSQEGIGRTFWKSRHGNSHAFQNKAYDHDGRDQTKGQKVLAGQIRELT